MKFLSTIEPTAGAWLNDAARVLGLTHLCQGRLTTESGVAVSPADRTSQGTIYFTPFGGDLISLYDDGELRWKPYRFTQLSWSLSGKPASMNYDVYAYRSGSAVALADTIWDTNTTRGESPVLQDGVYVKSTDPGYRWLGTFRTAVGATGITEDSINRRFVWNANNRVRRKVGKVCDTGSWTYATNSWRALANSNANRFEIVSGLNLSVLLQIEAVVHSSTPSTGVYAHVGIGEDSTTANSAEQGFRHENGQGTLYASRRRAAPLGYHYYQALDRAEGGTASYFHDADRFPGGIFATWEC